MNALEFAKAWEDGWNSHDLNTIMDLYREDIVFRSQKAVPLVGCGHEKLVISYLNHRGVLATETLYLDAEDKVFLAAACHKL